jgi:hypothetical protein
LKKTLKDLPLQPEISSEQYIRQLREQMKAADREDKQLKKQLLKEKRIKRKEKAIQQVPLDLHNLFFITIMRIIIIINYLFRDRKMHFRLFRLVEVMMMMSLVIIMRAIMVMMMMEMMIVKKILRMIVIVMGIDVLANSNTLLNQFNQTRSLNHNNILT